MLDLIRFTCFTSTKVQMLTQNCYAAFRAGDLDARSYCTSFFDLLAGAEEAGAQFFVRFGAIFTFLGGQFLLFFGAIFLHKLIGLYTRAPGGGRCSHYLRCLFKSTNTDAEGRYARGADAGPYPPPPRQRQEVGTRSRRDRNRYIRLQEVRTIYACIRLQDIQEVGTRSRRDRNRYIRLTYL
jgi:hypothetical protein